MEIILKQDVKGLGFKDDIVKVKDGFANNYLIPKGMAIPATPANRKVLAENLRQSALKQEKIKAAAQEKAKKLEGVSVQIIALTGEDGRIFGSVTTTQIVEALKNKGIEVDRRRITIDDEIKFVGNYTATINLHREIKVKIGVEVVKKQ
ncbi:MAG: 50S ribosomal protein L9 [Bacteroidia bacterium]|nr:50S ribosomal protein L9 [Bacteroidia bacterium]MDW8347047.1 50S ribosomal protein L9 [Bacteroidia bacterium]